MYCHVVFFTELLIFHKFSLGLSDLDVQVCELWKIFPRGLLLPLSLLQIFHLSLLQSLQHFYAFWMQFDQEV